MKANINGVDYLIDEGAVLTFCKNETLDSAKIRISNVDKMTLEPFDIVILSDSRFGDDITMLIDTYSEIMVCLNPKIYSYDIDLFSATKDLENYVLPSLKITKMPNRVIDIKTYLERYNDLYGPKIRIGDEFGYSWTNKYVFSDSVISKYTGIECPEMQWNQPTFREVLNDLMMVKDCIPRVNYGRKELSENETGTLSNVMWDYSEPCVVDFTFTYTTNMTFESIPINIRLDIVVDVHDSEIGNMERYSAEILSVSLNNVTHKLVINGRIYADESANYDPDTFVATITNYRSFEASVRTVEIDLLDLTEIANDISENTDVNYIQTSRSSEDYVSDLHMKLVNVTNPKDLDLFTTRNEYVPLTANEALITTQNLIVKTQYPIYNLKSFKIISNYEATLTNGNDDEDINDINLYVEFDLMNLVLDDDNVIKLIYEEQEWRTKNVDYEAMSDISFEDWGDYTTTTLYYTRNSNIITGFSQTSKKWLVFDTILIEKLLLNLGKYASKYALSLTDDYDGYWLSEKWPGISNTWRKTFFKIEYETLESSIFRASKDDYPKHHRTVIDNQTNSYTDSYNQGFLEYQKANRLGNEQLQINARTTFGSPTIHISDYYEDNIVFQTQYQIFNNHIEISALATKDYILRNYFTGVKSKIRSWVISSGSEALTRHDINKFYLEFSYSRHLEDLTDRELIEEYFLAPLYSYTAESLTAALIQTYDEDTNSYPSYNTDRYCLDLITRLIGNSLVFTWGLQDNYWVDKYVTSFESGGDGLSGYQGLGTKYYSYTDSLGEFEQIIYSITDAPSSAISNGSAGTGTGYESLWARPKVNLTQVNNTKFTYHITNYYKDSQEIPFISTQFEVCSDTHNIRFTDTFLRYQKCVRKSDYSALNLKIQYDAKSNYNFRNIKTYVGGAGTVVGFVYDSATTECRIGVTGYAYNTEEDAKNKMKQLIEDKAVYICDGNNVLLAFNDIPEENIVGVEYEAGHFRPGFKFYLNYLKDRDKAVYESQSNQVIKTYI